MRVGIVFQALGEEVRIFWKILLVYDLIIAHEIGIILRQERTEWSWHIGSRGKEPLQYLWHLVGLDIVTAESCTNRHVSLLPIGECSLGKLRSLSADGSIDGKHNATVGLLEIQIEALP